MLNLLYYLKDPTNKITFIKIVETAIKLKYKQFNKLINNNKNNKINKTKKTP